MTAYFYRVVDLKEAYGCRLLVLMSVVQPKYAYEIFAKPKHGCLFHPLFISHFLVQNWHGYKHSVFIKAVFSTLI